MATIKEDYVSFETAKLLKEKGFDEPCHCLWINPQNSSPYNSVTGDIDGNVIKTYEDIDPKVIHQWYLCPTLQMVMKWLRKVYNLCLFVIPATIDETFRTGYALYPQCDSRWEWCASKNDRSKATFGFDINKKYCDSYEEACEAVIKYCLKYLI